MALRSMIQKAAATAFKAVGDIKSQCTYDAFSDDGIAAPSSTAWPINVLFGEFSIMERNNEHVQPGDVVGTVLVAEMQCKPKRGHSITRTSDGAIFSVVGVTADPVDATYRLHLRGL